MSQLQKRIVLLSGMLFVGTVSCNAAVAKDSVPAVRTEQSTGNVSARAGSGRLIAQASPTADKVERRLPPHSAPVVVNGKELFKVYGDTEEDTDKRLRLVTAAIGKLVDDSKFHPSSLTVRNNADSSDIVFGDKPLFSITQQDALGEGVPLSIVADKWLLSIKTTIESERYRRNLSDAIDQVKLGTVKTNLLYFLGNPLSLRIGISVLGLLILSVISYSVKKSIPKYFHESNTRRFGIAFRIYFDNYFVPEER